MSATELTPGTAAAEAARLMTICNSCRYCESLCAVFPAMELRRDFGLADVHYLANLCHGCGACYSDCQFAPPHEFSVNVPATFAALRAETFRTYAWPRPMRAFFAWPAMATAGLAVLAAAAIAALIALVGTPVPAPQGADPGAFYRLMPHWMMAGLFGVVAIGVVLALYAGVRRFRAGIGGLSAAPSSWWQAGRDAGRLRYLDGGGVGCMNDDEAPTDRRRLFHHLTFYGFGLCFASTAVATGYHYLLGREAPYGWFEPPVILGTLGGIGLVVGTAGLLRARLGRDPALTDHASTGLDVTFIVMLLLTGASGLALLALRSTGAMSGLLVLHLAVVLALFVTMPYGKFVHGLYRLAALIRFAGERDAGGHR